MSLIGKRIRELRKKKNLTLRQLADDVGIDVGLLSKIERGQRQPTKSQVHKIAAFFDVEPRNLLVKYLSDKLLYQLKDEDYAREALKVAEDQLTYHSSEPRTTLELIEFLQTTFRQDERIEKAWIFGSYARKEQTNNSDLDIMLQFKEDKRITLFDLADIQYQLEAKTGIKIDLVEKGAVKQPAVEHMEKDLQLIYNAEENEG